MTITREGFEFKRDVSQARRLAHHGIVNACQP